MSTEADSSKPEKEQEESHVTDPIGHSEANRGDALPRRPPTGIVEEALAMFAHAGPMRDPLLEKIGTDQINRTLEIRAKREENMYQVRLAQQKSADALTTKILLFLGFVLVVVTFLTWLFLHYSKTDQVFNLIALLFTGGGGVGIGLGLKRRNRADLPNLSIDDDIS